MTLTASIEAVLLAAGEPVSVERIAEGLGVGRGEVLEALRRLAEEHAARAGGIAVIEIAGGWSLATRPEAAEAVEKVLRKTRKTRLTRAALETLAIVAYRQPVTRAEIEAIRGVNVDGVMRTLLEKDLVRIVGKKDEPGSPLLYATTQEFLLHFGLRAIDDLPPLRELEEIASAAPEGEVTIDDLEAAALARRERLRDLAEAAERELAGVGERLKGLRIPRLERPPGPHTGEPPAGEAPAEGSS